MVKDDRSMEYKSNSDSTTDSVRARAEESSSVPVSSAVRSISGLSLRI
jgi:hypothetical protein